MHSGMDTTLKNLIVFDMDGVIMDVSQSYRETIRRTATYFFQGAPAYEDLPNPLFSLEDLAKVKQSGGLNNDWETTYLVVSLLLTQVELPDMGQENDSRQLLQETMAHCDLSRLISFLKSRSFPLSDLLHSSDPVENPLVKQLSAGDVGSGNIVKQIFQEIYLGKNLFETTYRIPVATHFDKGLIDQERLIIDPSLLETLSRHHILAIATGRPEAEAAYPLKRFGIQDYFSMVLTLDDCMAAAQKHEAQTGEQISLSKPHPFMLDVIARAFAGKVKKNYYIGDMPDDMVAAQRAVSGFTGIGVAMAATGRHRVKNMLMQAGADHVIDDVTQLENVLSGNELR